jgi:hypothetical protein
MTMPETDMSKKIQQKIDSIESTLNEILKWTKFANISKLKEILEAELDTDEKKLAYENSNGENTLKDLVPLCGAPYGTITNWWPRWYRMGIMAESELRKSRMEKIVSLDDVGIKIPKKTKTSAAPETVQALPVESAQPASTEGEKAQ